MMVILHYFRFAARSLSRHRLYSMLNLTGMAVGIALCLLMLNYVLFEKSYDQFNTNKDQIVRVTYDRFIDGEFQFSKAQVFPVVADALIERFPEVQKFTRIFPMATHVEAVFSVVTNDQTRHFLESSVYATDSSFLKIFSLQLLIGDSLTALDGDKKIILSSTAARRYFGEETAAMNQVIHWEGMGDFVVTGVYRDFPANSHMHFDFLTSWMKVYEDGSSSNWNWDGFYTYLLIKPGTDMAVLAPEMQKVLNVSMSEAPGADRMKSEFHFQPLKDIHLQSHLEGELEVNGSEQVVDALMIVAIFIFILAVVNYLNLSLARAIRRGKEVGIRKIIGSSRSQLMGLFFTEAFVLNLIAFVLAAVLWRLASPYFNSLVGKEVGFMFGKYLPAMIFTVIIVLAFSAWLAGIFPARMLSSINPAMIIKGVDFGSGRKVWLRRQLLIFQFLVTIILVTGTWLVWEQVRFMQGQDLGFSLEQNVVVRSLSGPGAEMDTTFTYKLELFKQRATSSTHVKNVTITSNIPGRENEWKGRLMRVENEREMISTSRTRVDQNFIATYGLKLLEGRNFTDEGINQVILNESAARMLGYKNNIEAIGGKIMKDHSIVGVIQDYHERSLREPLVPMMFTMGAGYMKLTNSKTLLVYSTSQQTNSKFI